MCVHPFARSFGFCLFISVFAVSCSTPNPTEDPAPDASPASVAKPSPHPDPGPQFQHKASSARVDTATKDPHTSTLVAFVQEGDASWWLFDRPQTRRLEAQCEVFRIPDHPQARVVPMHSVRTYRNLPMPTGTAAKREHIVARVPGKQAPKELRLEVYSRPCAYYNAQGAETVQREQWSVPRTKPTQRTDARTLKGLFWYAAANTLKTRDAYVSGGAWSTQDPPHEAFLFARSEAISREFLQPPPKPQRGRKVKGKTRRNAAPVAEQMNPRRRSDLGETMSLYTGMSSIEEALQHDRGLRLTLDQEARTVPIASLQGVPLPAHPWPTMVKSLPSPPVMESMAAFVPDDMIYIFAHDLRQLASITREIGQWSTPLSLALEHRAGTSKVMKRYETQLILERRGLVEKFGNLAAKSAALVASDPFLREGTDVSLLFETTNADLLQNTLNTYVANAKAKHSDLASKPLNLGPDVVATQTSTPDRRLHQIRAQYKNLLIVSNSENAVRRILKTARGAAPSLQQSGDFQFMRGLYPARQKDEDLFVFIGDKAVQNAVSPRTKILQSRRMRAHADMLAVGYGAILHAWVHKTPTTSIQDAVQSGVLTPEDLKLSIDQSPITYDATRGRASSKVWGHSDMLTPLAELSINNVSKREAEAYKRFQDTYQSYWRSFIDPIAIRIRRSDPNSLDIDGRMIPLIDSSEYNELVELVGDNTITTPALPGTLQWSFAVGEQARLRQELNQMVRTSVMNRDVHLDWLGDWITLGTSDRASLWDLAIAFNAFPTLQESKPNILANDKLLQVLPDLPLYVGAHIRNPGAFALVLAGLRRELDSSLQGVATWDQDGFYRDVPIQRILENTEMTRGSRAHRPLALHYAIVKNTVFVSFNRAVIEERIDDALDGRLPVSADAKDNAEALQTYLSATPRTQGDTWLSKVVLGVMENINSTNSGRASLVWEDVARTVPNALQNPETHSEASLGLFNVIPRTAHNDAFTLQPTGAASSLYGTPMVRQLPQIPVAQSPLTDLILSLKSLHMGVAFEDIADHKGLRVRARWTR